MTDATNALLPCPCGKTPTALVIVQHGDSKHAHCAGNCCGEWEVEFRTNFHHPTSAEAKRRAVSRWNDAHRQPTASAGMVVVPREPTEAMLDAGRTAVMARDCSGPKWGPADHFEATGFDTTGIPSRLLEGRYKMSKEWGAELVYAAMLAAHESQSPPADTTPDVSERGQSFDFRAHLQRQRDWSEKTFGPGPRTAGVIDHIRKELCEIEADPSDISEWIDAVILALDGAWRAGHSPDDIIAALVGKQTKNEARTWPDWRTMPTDKAIEHVRTTDNVEGE